MRKRIKIWFLIMGLIITNIFLRSRELPQCQGGFITIDPVHFYFHTGSYKGRFPLTSSTAKIWHVIQRADEDWRDKPLFVFFNGGPGAGTSSGLMISNTAKKTLNILANPIADDFEENTNSWTQLGNLLYVDARQTGFSFSEIPENVDDIQHRLQEFNAQNFNVYFDAADFIRIILTIFDNYPELKDNRVILVGESYGGIRANMILFMLLHYPYLASGGLPNFYYQDPDLAQRLERHFQTLYPDIDQEAPYDWVKLQFSHQILIQPALDYTDRNEITGEMLVAKDSPIYTLSKEIGIPFIPVSPEESGISYRNQVHRYVTEVAKRDVYFYDKPGEWTINVFSKASTLLMHVDKLRYFLDQDISQINEFYASNRENAYRVIDTHSYQQIPPGLSQEEEYLLCKWLNQKRHWAADPSDLHVLFGTLQDWDRFHIDLHMNVNLVFAINVAGLWNFNATARDSYPGFRFLRNLLFVNTFITNAKYDLVVYSNAIPEVFRRGHSYAVAEVKLEERIDEERPGEMLINFVDGWGRNTDIRQARIRFPGYLKSGHAVSLTEPMELLADVKNWLAEKLEDSGHKENHEKKNEK